ncbi:MAG: hypothetical protein WEE89_13950 [Gemmatimonadota bacterium]
MSLRKSSVAAKTVTNPDGDVITVSFLGEVEHQELFGTLAGRLPVPISAAGAPEGVVTDENITWLRFRYSTGNYSRLVLVAKRPIVNYVSWDAIARSGAALGDGSTVVIGEREYPQHATVADSDGQQYLVRLPRCGQGTFAHVSEWNLLIGGVHEGDIDFSGDQYGWLRIPYTDTDLAVGKDGSLTWCADRWASSLSHRVARGYFFVSRFHAAPSHTRTDRLQWRPVLERFVGPPIAAEGIGRTQRSLDGRVAFLGRITHDSLLGTGPSLADRFGLAEGSPVLNERPDWLVFWRGGKTLLIAAKPVRRSISWEALARLGVVSGDGSVVDIRGRGYVQGAELSDMKGNRYSLRLLRCGSETLDSSSEWNQLLGGVHQGDSDFSRQRNEAYGWITQPMSDDDLHIGELDGSATWCQERHLIDGKYFAVNRGYLTISRYHLSEISFKGSGFGWRPVLELK